MVDDEKPKKRSILGRRSRRAAEPAATAEPVTEPVPDEPTPAAEPTPVDEIVVAEVVADEVEVDEVVPAEPTAAEPTAAEPTPAEPTPATAPAATGFMPLFQAPDLPTYVPPAPGRQAAPQSAQNGAQQGGTGPQAGQAPDPDQPSASSRRRSRRRAGDEPRDGEDAPNTTVRVRQPRQAPLITEPQRVKGSTRLEAKKQRRRDGRDAGRRRAVVTEAEFLARRESVDRVMIVRESNQRTQIAVLEDGVLVEHYVARASEASLIGNVYLGRVQNVLPSMEAAFVDIGRGRNAVLYSGEVDWDAVQAVAENKNQPRRIELALKQGDRLLVQVTKDPVGHKGARLTSQVSLPGRYLVYVPGGSMNGISRKLPDTERARLKKILKEVLPDDAGVIVRTAAEGATEEQLTLDVQRLTSQWAEIERAVEIGQAPSLLHSEPDLLIKIVRDVFNEDFHKLVIAGADAQATIEKYLRAVAPDLVDRVETYSGDGDAFDAYRVSEQIEKALDRKVWLPSGGSLVIDRTEAMTVVDVNTGKFVGSGGNLEETVTKNNLEAAEEIVRQLRLRDIGGIIVVDFIDMVLESNRDLVLRRLVECLSRDRTKHQVAEVTSLGLVQMTRKKLGLGLLESFSEPCEVCAGRGIIVHHDPVSKHRGNGGGQQQGGGSEGSGSRGRRGRGGGNQTPPSSSSKPNSGSNGTHAITDDVLGGLARIAKSTVAHDARPATGEVPVVAEAPVAERMPAAEPVDEAASVDLIDLPTARGGRPSRRISTHDAELILDSVLDALPEPKAPGAGRGRGSRRAGTSGAVITPASD